MAAGTAQAFEKTGSGGNANSPGPAKSLEKSLDLSSGKTLERKEESGGVRIPGLGTLGVLPKLDFGLELLYGEGQTPAVEPRQEDEPDTDGLRIRGTLKHRF